MKFIPILFSTEMVIAILEDRKTQTRRTKKLDKLTNHYFQSLVHHASGLFTFVENGNYNPTKDEIIEVKPPYAVGDVLWVRETLYQNGELGIEYVAGNEGIHDHIIPKNFKVRLDKDGNYKFCKIPNIYMEKWACRIFLKVKSIRVERLNCISESDAIAEGIKPTWIADNINECKFKNYINNGKGSLYPIESFTSLWQKINGEASWKSNPFVWVIEFEKIIKPENFI